MAKKKEEKKPQIPQIEIDYRRLIEEMSDDNYKVACRYAVDLHKDFANVLLALNP